MSNGGGRHGQNVYAASIARMNARLRMQYHLRERERRIAESLEFLKTFGTPRKPSFFQRIVLALRAFFGLRVTPQVKVNG